MALSPKEKRIFIIGIILTALVPVIVFSITGLHETMILPWSETEITVIHQKGLITSLCLMDAVFTCTICTLIRETFRASET